MLIISERWSKLTRREKLEYPYNLVDRKEFSERNFPPETFAPIDHFDLIEQDFLSCGEDVRVFLRQRDRRAATLEELLYWCDCLESAHQLWMGDIFENGITVIAAGSSYRGKDRYFPTFSVEPGGWCQLHLTEMYWPAHHTFLAIRKS